MTNVIQFDTKKRSAGRVYCPPLDIYFPSLVKITQTFPDGLDFDALGMIPRSTSIIHTFEDSQAQYPYLTDETPIQCLAPDDVFSLLMRFHTSKDAANNYRLGLHDFGIAPVLSFTVVASEQGFFTLLSRPLTGLNPTPTITYAADYIEPSADFPEKEWVRSIGPGGPLYSETHRAGDDTELTSLLPNFF